jgi:mono/diheme cytochrome c family protein
MPDMAYSRAVETYSDIDTLQKQGIHYDRMPVAGTIKRGEVFPFPLEKDKPGDTTNYVLSKTIPNPLPAMNEAQKVEAERLYLVNCAICHGVALDGNGPLHTRSNGDPGPYLAAPAAFIGKAQYENMPIGQMFYSATYGKNLMGPYASQMSTTQRWMVVQYIKDKQSAGKTAAQPAAGADSTAAPK